MACFIGLRKGLSSQISSGHDCFRIHEPVYPLHGDDGHHVRSRCDRRVFLLYVHTFHCAGGSDLRDVRGDAYGGRVQREYIALHWRYVGEKVNDCMKK